MDSPVDAALPVLTGVDRRALIRLVLAGTAATAATAGAALAAESLAVTSWDGPQATLDSVRRTVAGLAALYDSAGPREIVGAVEATELSMAGVFAEFTTMSERMLREAKATYAQLLTMAATAADDTGAHAKAARTGQLAASLAMEVGDSQTAGHAWSVVASALSNSGRGRLARSAAQRAHAAAAGLPAGVMALVEEAATAAKMGHVHTVLDVVTVAEAEHAKLPAQAWGTPGYSLGSFHGAKMSAFIGWSLAKVGLYREAAPRLADAAELAAGTGLMVFVRLAQARASLGTGDVDAAHGYAAMAVASAEPRPAAWVGREVRELDHHSGGALAALVDQTARWGFTAA